MPVKTQNGNGSKTVKASKKTFNKKLINNKKLKYLKKSLYFNCNENGYIIKDCLKKKVSFVLPNEKGKLKKKFNDFNLFLVFFFGFQ